MFCRFKPIVLALAAFLIPAAVRAEPVELTPYSEIRGASRIATAEEFAKAAADNRFVFEKLPYPSDGLTVFAYVYRPVATGKKLPVIIFNRGSYTWPTFASEMLVMANRFAQAGYVVVAPMYRGSGGADGRDELGGADLDDLFAILLLIKTMPAADPDRLYLFGESRGGMMVYQALRDGFPARAAAVVGAFTDLDALLKLPAFAGISEKIWPDLAQHRAQIVKRRSAILWAEKIKTPLLILQGEKDESIPVDQALRFAEKLSAAGGDYELRVVNGGDHVLSHLAGKREAWISDWFKAH